LDSAHQLNLVNVGWPICLLVYQQQLSRLAPGEVLKVQVEDPEVAASILQLARRQKDRIRGDHREGKVMWLTIQRHKERP
jgi:TusA-related sulfurtransferase